MGRLKPNRSKIIGLLLATAMPGLMAGCDGGGSGSSDGDRGTLSLVDTPDYLIRGETADVKITKSRDAALATTISELELGIDITPGGCTPPAPLCELWSVTPRPDAISASYRVGAGYLDQIDSNSVSFGFNVLPGASAPAAVDVSIGGRTDLFGFYSGGPNDAVITTDGRVWGLGDKIGLPGTGLLANGYDTHINQPFPTSLSNVQQLVFLAGSVNYRGSSYTEDGDFYVIYRDGTASYFELSPGTSSLRRLPVVDQSDQPVTNLRSMTRRFALLDDGILRYQGQGVVTRRAYPPDSGQGPTGLPGNVIQVVEKYPEQAANIGRLFLTLHSDGTVWQGGRRFDTGNDVFYEDFSPPWGYPVQTTLSNMIQVDVGYAQWANDTDRHNYGVALGADGIVWVWVPYDDTSRSEALPRQVPGLSNIVEIAVHGPVILGRDVAGDVWQMEIDTVANDGSFSYDRTATRVPWISGARTIAVGRNHAMAVLDDCGAGGTVRSWALTPYRNHNVPSMFPGDGVHYQEDITRGEFQPAPVIGIGDADPGCPRKVLFYKSGNTKGGDIDVTSNTGNMVCDNYLCWESVNPATSSLAIQINSRVAGVPVTPQWDCQGQGNSFTLNVGTDDVYCKLTTSALQLHVDQLTTYNITDNSRSYTSSALGHRIESIPSGLISVPGDQDSATVMLPRDTSLQLVATPAAGYAFSSWEGSGCGSDGSVTLSERNLSCKARFVEVTSTGGNGGQYTLTLTLAGGPGAGQVYSLPANPPAFECINSAEITTTCSQAFNAGQALNLFAEAFDGTDTISWRGCDMDNTDGCFVTMDSDRNIAVIFTPAGG